MAIDKQKPAARLHFRNTKVPEWSDIPIYPNDEFRIGRRDFEDCWREFSQPEISKSHLHLRCVCYDEDGPVRVEPMVYVRVLSKNDVQLSSNLGDGTITKDMISRANGDILLDHGDVLHITRSVSVHFLTETHCTSEVEGLNTTQRIESACFGDKYQMTNRMLGVGGHASVFVAVKVRTRQQLACKIIPMPFLDLGACERKWDEYNYDEAARAISLRKLERNVAKQREDIPREYNILADLNHPNIIGLEKVFCTPSNFYIFEELVTGGDLLSYLDKNGALKEPQAVVIVRQVLKAVEYLHENGMVHRDIKPENVLMTSWRNGARVVLTDFGQARTINDAEDAAREAAVFRMQSLVGTLGYVAPEVLERKMKHNAQGYSKSIDIWALGCIAAILLTGEILFPGQDKGNEEDEAPPPAKCYDLSVLDHGPRWRRVGRKAKSFIRGCCAADEKLRLTAKQATQHIWFSNPHYYRELEDAYKRAIEDWMPRAETENVVEFLETGVPAPGKDMFVEDTKSRHFADRPPLTQMNNLCKSSGEGSNTANPSVVATLGDPRFASATSNLRAADAQSHHIPQLSDHQVHSKALMFDLPKPPPTH